MTWFEVGGLYECTDDHHHHFNVGDLVLCTDIDERTGFVRVLSRLGTTWFACFYETVGMFKEVE